MKSMTIRGIEAPLERELKKVAKKEGKSVNQVVIDTLKAYYGLRKEKKFTRIHHDLDHLFGKWTQTEFEKIQGKIDAERNIDPELWK